MASDYLLANGILKLESWEDHGGVGSRKVLELDHTHPEGWAYCRRGGVLALPDPLGGKKSKQTIKFSTAGGEDKARTPNRRMGPRSKSMGAPSSRPGEAVAKLPESQRLTDEDIEDMGARDLRAALLARKLETSGRRHELEERLKDYVRQATEKEDNAPPPSENAIVKDPKLQAVIDYLYRPLAASDRFADMTAADIFRQIDEDNDSVLTTAEIVQVLVDVGYDEESEDVTNVRKTVDGYFMGRLDYHTFSLARKRDLEAKRGKREVAVPRGLHGASTGPKGFGGGGTRFRGSAFRSKATSEKEIPEDREDRLKFVTEVRRSILTSLIT